MPSPWRPDATTKISQPQTFYCGITLTYAGTNVSFYLDTRALGDSLNSCRGFQHDHLHTHTPAGTGSWRFTPRVRPQIMRTSEWFSTQMLSWICRGQWNTWSQWWIVKMCWYPSQEKRTLQNHDTQPTRIWIKKYRWTSCQHRTLASWWMITPSYRSWSNHYSDGFTPEKKSLHLQRTKWAKSTDNQSTFEAFTKCQFIIFLHCWKFSVVKTVFKVDEVHNPGLHSDCLRSVAKIFAGQ